MSANVALVFDMLIGDFLRLEMEFYMIEDVALIKVSVCKLDGLGQIDLMN